MIILSVGGLLYGRFCAHVFGPDDRPTAAVAKRDGVVYVPMKKWRNALIELLNIAGTGPVLGPIQGILFGPVAFILIPIGCVLGGAVHDYFCGMMSVRHDGRQMPGLVEGYLSRGTYHVFNVFICLLMFLLGVVFIYTPGDMIVGSIMGLNTSFIAADGGFVGFGAIAPLFVVFALIFVYYLLATFLPIDKIIGRIYPIFGAILLLSAGGIFVALFATGGVQMLDELCGQWSSWVSIDNIVPMFFVTVTCGIVSGFHNSQACIIARSVKDEHEGLGIFYGMMIAEGFIAMIWAAAAMVIYNEGMADAGSTNPIAVVGIVSRSFLGDYGGIVAVLGVIVLAITSGDTALRSLRLMIGDYLHIDPADRFKQTIIVVTIFVPLTVALIFAKLDAHGFNILWRYFSFANETCAVFAFSLITVYLYEKKKAWIIAFVPGCFYAFVVSSYLLAAPIGFNLSWPIAYTAGGVLTVVYAVLVLRAAHLRRARSILT